MWLCILVIAAVSAAVSAGKRQPIGRVVITKGESKVSYEVPISVPNGAGSTMMKAIFSALFSEVIVIDSRCGQRRNGCPRYCDNAEFSEFYCQIDCQNTTVSLPLQSCKFPRYDPTQSAESELIRTNWSTRIGITRKLYGDIRRDRVTIHNWPQSRDQSVTVRMRFVSARWFDNRALSNEAAIIGMKPGPDAAIPQIIAELGCEEPILCVAQRGYNDPMRHPAARAVRLHGTLGGIDKAFCKDFHWMQTEGDLVVKVAKVNFMGVWFENVELILELVQDAIIIPIDAGNTLESAGVLRQLAKIGYGTVYTYNCSGDPPIQFFNDNGEMIMEWKYETLKWMQQTKVPCIVNLGADSTDIFTITRYSQVWQVGFNFLRTHCVAFDYSTNRLGIGRRRQWFQPTPYA